MSISAKMPEFRRDRVSVITNVVVVAVVGMLSGGLWMLVR